MELLCVCVTLPWVHMKVLIVTSIYPTAENPTLGTFVRTQVEYLKRAGIDVELFLVRGRPQKLAYLKAPFQLRRRLSNGLIDLIHAHYSYPGMIARTQWKVPVVVSFCGDDLLGTIDERGEPTYFSRIAAAAGRLLSTQADAVIVKSREMARKLTRSDVHIIPNEVDFEVFRPMQKESARRSLGLDLRRTYLLFAANPQIPVKRYPLARLAAEELKKNDPTVELLTVHKEPQKRLALFMNACDALLVTSYQEGSPNIVKQAMACNLPIVSTDVGDVREVFDDTKGCYVSEPDAREFAMRVADVLRWGERTQGFERVRHLSGPAVAQRVIRVYEDVLRMRGERFRERERSTAFSAGK